MSFPFLSPGRLVALYAEVQPQAQQLWHMLTLARQQNRLILPAIVKQLQQRQDLYDLHQKQGLQQKKRQLSRQRQQKEQEKLQKDREALQQRSLELRQSMQVTNGQARDRIQEIRLQLQLQIDSRKMKMKALQDKDAKLSQELLMLQPKVQDLQAQLQAANTLCSQWQSQLTSAASYFKAISLHLSLGHIVFQQDQDLKAWHQIILDCTDALEEVCFYLEGSYGERLEQSLYGGGRVPIVAEILYAAMLAGQKQQSAKVFASVQKQGNLSKDLWPVFRLWTLGLWITEQYKDLEDLVTLYRFAPGLHGIYAQAYLALLENKPQALKEPLQRLLRLEWHLYQKDVCPALGVINVAAVFFLKQMCQERESWQLPWKLPETKVLPKMLLQVSLEAMPEDQLF